MWIVKLALRQPYTFAVLAVLILLLGVFTITRMATDIFPVINIPVVTLIWSFPGVTPNDMEKRYVNITERAMTTTVLDIEHIESQSVSGIGVVKIYFQPDANLPQGIAQVTATAQTVLRALPPGTTPPLIIRYDASDVPILQMGVSSPVESDTQIADNAQNFIRTQLVTIKGAQVPLPYGGQSRQIMVDLDPQALNAKGLSPVDVNNAISAQNLVLATGDLKVGKRDYTVQTNSSPQVVDQLNDIPIKYVNGALITIRDVANVRDGGAVQQNAVDQDGRQGVLLTVLKSGNASTLDVVSRVKEMLPKIEATLPPDLKINLLQDQSIFVKASITGVVTEATIAALLTATMILLFLGSLRSTFIVAVSIPLSILSSILVLGATGQTLNTMTLGGLALAVGILVDDTTVTIENINRYLAQGEGLRKSILDGSAEIALPALVSTISICIVFLPVVLLSGVARYLFLPLAEAVIFAMLASYLLSRTLTPTLVSVLLRHEVSLYAEEGGGEHGGDAKNGEQAKGNGAKQGDGAKNGKHGVPVRINQSTNGNGANGHTAKIYEANGNGANGNGARHGNGAAKNENNGNGKENGNGKDGKKRASEAERVAKIKRGLVWRTHEAFNKRFEAMRERYRGLLIWIMDHRAVAVIVFAVFCGLSFCLLPFIGRDFFPQVDAGTIRMHVRVPPSTRLEETGEDFANVETEIRREIPPDQVSLILDNIGLPSNVNLAFGDSATIGPSDGEIDVSLSKHHDPTEKYQQSLRRNLQKKFPDYTFFFEPADIVSQILNFGLPAPIDVQVSGPPRNQVKNYGVAQQLAKKIAAVPGAADVHLQQVVDAPSLFVNVDRVRAQQLGLTQQQVANSLLISLASSGQASPSYFLDPKNGVNYSVAVQTPQYRLSSPDDLLSTPLIAQGATSQPLLSSLATITHNTSPVVIDHYNIQPVYDVYLSPENRDLGGVDNDIQKILDGMKKSLPRGTTITVRGQVQDMNESFTGLIFGLMGAVVLVYLLLVINYQSWVDPLVVVSGAPAALSGILWMLFITQTPFSVPALMGAIMTIGVSTANSVLLVTFANERRDEGMEAVPAAIAAGYTRLRPVIMTALAMIIGMLPMALGLGDGGEQNAPLGRAVIGGLFVATFSTLLFVPVVYSALRKKQPEIDEMMVGDDDEDDTSKKPKRQPEPAKRTGEGHITVPVGASVPITQKG